MNTVDLPIRPAKPKPVDRSTAVGLDLGIKNFLITSDGEVFENQKYLTRNLKRLRVEQRSLARKQKGSTNREKQRLVVAKLHEKIANQRKDFLQQLSTELVNQYDTICMEDLHVKGMVRNHCLARSISE
ncbi:MAG: RNA-guided endonuclease InsQ/TnpB family protein, partial [Cyclobacteriaceae bacterium]